jgi:hypothetical protein
MNPYDELNNLKSKNQNLTIRKLKIIFSTFLEPKFRQLVKHHINLAYRRKLLEGSGVRIIDPMTLSSFDNLELRLSGAEYQLGNTTYLEMICILGLVAKWIDDGKNFLEIGTFDGNMARNIASNIGENSKVITIDLPEASDANNVLMFDNELILSERRKNKKHLDLTNIEQVYGDSTKLDFSAFDFHGAFIDGGHDLETVRSDTINVLNNIKTPGFIVWHDYEMESDIDDLISSLLNSYDVCYVEGTRMAVLELKK